MEKVPSIEVEAEKKSLSGEEKAEAGSAEFSSTNEDPPVAALDASEDGTDEKTPETKSPPVEDDDVQHSPASDKAAEAESISEHPEKESVCDAAIETQSDASSAKNHDEIEGSAEEDKAEETPVEEPIPEKEEPPSEAPIVNEASNNPFESDEDDSEEAKAATDEAPVDDVREEEREISVQPSAKSDDTPVTEVPSIVEEKEELYPDDMNPFGDEDEEADTAALNSVEERKSLCDRQNNAVKKTSTNPFGSDFEDSEEEVVMAR